MAINNKLDGTILNYHPDKGFGFIQTRQNKELFFHIRDYRPNKEPVIGEKIVFDLGKDKQGRICAVNIQELSFILNKEHQAQKRLQKRQAYDAYQERQEQKHSVLNLICAIALVYLIVIAILAIFLKAMTWLLLWYLVIGAVSFFVYYLDKAAALNDNRRTPENTLHLIDVLGGWIGASFAHKFLNHKATKAKFRLIFYLTIALNIIIVAGLVYLLGV